MWEADSRGSKCGRIIKTTNLFFCKIIRPSLVLSVSWDPINSLCHAEGQWAPCRSLRGAFTSQHLDLDTFTVENLIYGNGRLVLPNVAIPCCQSTVVWQQRQGSDSSDVPPPGVSGATHSRDSTEPSRELRSTAKRVGNLCSSETAASQPKGWKNDEMFLLFPMSVVYLFLQA